MITWAWICLSFVIDLHVFRSSKQVLMSSVVEIDLNEDIIVKDYRMVHR